MTLERVAGEIEVKSNGVNFSAVGSFTINLGTPKREAEMGSDNKVHGYSEKGQAPYIKGAIRDYSSLNVEEDVFNIKDATITLKAANGKLYYWSDAFYSGTGDITTDNGEVNFECQAASAGVA